MKRTILLTVIAVILFLASAFLPTLGQEPQTERAAASIAEENRPVIVAGAVVVPTRIVLRRRVRLSEGLTVAGGLTKNAKGVIQLIHREGTFESFRWRDVKGGDVRANPYLRSGDVISVF